VIAAAALVLWIRIIVQITNDQSAAAVAQGRLLPTPAW
jgi:hypothetical protein